VLDARADVGVAVDEVDRAPGGAGDGAKGDRLAAFDHLADRGVGAPAGGLALALRRLAQVVGVAGHRSTPFGVGEAGAGPGAAHRPVAGARLLKRGDDVCERPLLAAAALEPNVVLAHRLAGAALEQRLALFDQLDEPAEPVGRYANVRACSRVSPPLQVFSRVSTPRFRPRLRPLAPPRVSTG
jgi:hypothetical protein